MNISVESRQPNWLPIPGVDQKMDVPAVVVDENDLFPKGNVKLFYPQQGYGYIENRKGEELLFRLTEMELVGAKNHPKYIAAGCPVGYDVSWTSHGLHVNRMKVY